MPPLGAGRKQRSQALPQAVRNKINTHEGTLPTKNMQCKTHGSIHSETISKPESDVGVDALPSHRTLPSNTSMSVISSFVTGSAMADREPSNNEKTVKGRNFQNAKRKSKS